MKKMAETSKKETTKTQQDTSEDSLFKSLFGFTVADVSSFRSFERLMCRPTDPAGLAVMRFMFGVLMMVDIWQERGLGHILEDYGNTSWCRFPLFDFLTPLPLVWMYIVYLVMFIGELGITLGLCYRLSCLMFLIPYWYLFLLDKTTWNNHSYLYGLCGLLMLVTDGNRYWSIDGLLFKKKRHTHVPLWNYAMLRFQIFLVYFIAGLKKLDMDWVSGYSMNNIASHYVFHPFRYFLTTEQVSLLIVHLGGLTIDLSMGFLLFFDHTRKIAFTFLGAFHLMNSQMFSIGMFPWTMLATMPLFCHPSWPRDIIHKFPRALQCLLPADLPLQTSTHCIYSKKAIKAEEKSDQSTIRDRQAPPTRTTRLHRLMMIFVMCYVSVQVTMPYSHGISKGYNHWTQGLYGYSWDMMVHSWKLQHVKVTYVNKDTGEEGYLDPSAWGRGRRWSSHPDMVKQYSSCVKEKLQAYGLHNVELYIDVWRALNDRFQQRSIDPRVNMVEAPWSPFKDTPWLLPLLVDLSDWRERLAEIEKEIVAGDSHTDVVFVADFPGLHLENYVQPELGNTSVTVLQGTVVVELVDRVRNHTLGPGDKMQLPNGEFHNIHTVSTSPSCYMYVFVNTTDVAFQEIINKYDQIKNGFFSGTDAEAAEVKRTVEQGADSHLYRQMLEENQRQRNQAEMTLLQSLDKFVRVKFGLLQKSVKMTVGAVTSLVTGQPFEDFVNRTIIEEAKANMLREQWES